ncbi:outer envelope pore protein 16-2, chloroplastic-like [Panicum virgatum]|uniref:outer envelope pore protein 16-2, chloroplastic-like n=1 Tax=Panicum virgatum TaxID=38727 RepID=UPI0019D6604F|nr:outer envelope pore protein 16-2, chloroplastic-like [Panicum virgatum]
MELQGAIKVVLNPRTCLDLRLPDGLLLSLIAEKLRGGGMDDHPVMGSLGCPLIEHLRAGLSGDSAGLDPNGGKRSHFSSIRGDDGQKSLDAAVKSSSHEAFHWGLAAGVYSGLTYGLREARGCRDWKNSAIAGAIAGAAVALTGDAGGHSDKLVHFAITGAALSSAASLLSGVF